MKQVWGWVMFAAAATCWPLDLLWRTLLRQEVAPGRRISYRRADGRALTVPAWYRCDHSSFSPNLFRLDEAAAVAALLAWTVAALSALSAWLWGWQWPWWLVWMVWSFACGLAVRFSEGQFLHDYAYDEGRWDCGEMMSKAEADAVMMEALAREGHPGLVRRLYRWGIGTWIARWVWNSHVDGNGRPRMVERGPAAGGNCRNGTGAAAGTEPGAKAGTEPGEEGGSIWR